MYLSARSGLASQACRRWHRIEVDHSQSLWRAYFESRDDWHSPTWPFDVQLPRVPVHSALPAVEWKLECRRRHEHALKWQTACGLEPRHQGKVHLVLVDYSEELQASTADGQAAIVHKSLADAVSCSAPYDRIEVYPGQHHPANNLLLVPHPLEIIGKGAVGSVVLTGMLAVTTPHARIVNITIEPVQTMPGINQGSALAVKIFESDPSADSRGSDSSTPNVMGGSRTAGSHSMEPRVQLEECRVVGTVEVKCRHVSFFRNEVCGTISVCGLKDSNQNVTLQLPESHQPPTVQDRWYRVALEHNWVHTGPEALVTLSTYCSSRLSWNLIRRARFCCCARPPRVR